MLTTILLLLSSAFATHPLGDSNLKWGISVQELKAQYDVIKIDPENPHGQHYTDFSEIDPQVYINRSVPGQKIEFYFYEGKLYKTFIVHLDQEGSQEKYEQKLKELEKTFGHPPKHKQSSVFNLPVLHSVWDFEKEQYDLRFGAGYMYEVRIYKPAAEEKHDRQKDWQAI